MKEMFDLEEFCQGGLNISDPSENQIRILVFSKNGSGSELFERAGSRVTIWIHSPGYIILLGQQGSTDA